MRFLNWLKRAYGNLIFICILIFLLVKIISLVHEEPQNITEWLLVYLTGIYALIALYLAAISAKSAIAMERSAKAMEESLFEARLSRLAQYGANVQLAGRTYQLNDDGSVIIKILNINKQPITNLQISLWETEKGRAGVPEIKYSSMKQSDTHLIRADDEIRAIKLVQVNIPESERRKLGESALELFKQVHKCIPNDSLVLLTYNDKFFPFQPWNYTFDLKASPDMRIPFT